MTNLSFNLLSDFHFNGNGFVPSLFNNHCFGTTEIIWHLEATKPWNLCNFLNNYPIFDGFQGLFVSFICLFICLLPNVDNIISMLLAIEKLLLIANQDALLWNNG